MHSYLLEMKVTNKYIIYVVNNIMECIKLYSLLLNNNKKYILSGMNIYNTGPDIFKLP